MGVSASKPTHQSREDAVLGHGEHWKPSSRSREEPIHKGCQCPLSRIFFLSSPALFLHPVFGLASFALFNFNSPVLERLRHSFTKP